MSTILEMAPARNSTLPPRALIDHHQPDNQLAMAPRAARRLANRLGLTIAVARAHCLANGLGIE